ncbi:TadE/TadG family type IV pilus assembly protein [uncultured Alsobacter sp.]|uniref:vWA domain-containing protein n=1 Tax=uncultured Alsobacter sp. TaxID=1748258 RepID=UPI0025DE60C5|nr:TadE/TadG family type IV pilus assembly protein [uncultured Alsobacter sp.]
MSVLARFVKDTRGNFGVITAVMMVPLAIGAGGAVDYSRTVAAKTKLQAAVDSAALILAHDARTSTLPQLQARAETLVTQMFGSSTTGIASLKSVALTRNDKTIRIVAAAQAPTTTLKMAGMSAMDMNVASESAYGTRKIEVALVLDNTGSMAGTKITELRKAAKNLVTTLQGVQTDAGSVKIGLVPFTTQVRLDTAMKDQAWLDFATYGVAKASWGGCVTDRNQPFDVTDAGAALVPAVNCAAGTLARVVPLSTNFDALRTSIDGMTAGGNTNITIGLSWGMAALSNAEPLTGAAPDGSADVEKFMIVLTDGDNTQNRWSTSKVTIDNRTRAACDTAKTASRGIKLYTIRVIDGDANLLRDCASNTSMFYDVKQASDLDAVFRKIAQEIAAIRITS